MKRKDEYLKINGSTDTVGIALALYLSLCQIADAIVYAQTQRTWAEWDEDRRL